MKIGTVNVNGLRAAWRKGMAEWLAASDCDIVTLQEVRAPDDVVHQLLADTGYHVAHTASAQKGRNGVAILTRTEPKDVRRYCGDAHFDDSGRWIEADVPLNDGTLLTVVSVYMHTGEVGTQHQDDKFRLLAAMLDRMTGIANTADHGLVTGDLNIAHTDRDLRNFKGNVGKSGCLPEERRILDRVGRELGWVDVHRALSGDVDGPYTWWSMRGRAFDNDAGWRIDYHWATPVLGKAAIHARVDRAASWSERWSDHAPLVIDYASIS